MALGAVILVPVTIFSHDLMLQFPENYIIKWMNDTLIYGLWNYMFMGISLCVFIILPFAYFYQEAQGFGTGKGLLPPLYEAGLVLLLFGATVGGIIFVIDSVVNFVPESLSAYLPFLYSIITGFGSLFVMGFVPLGFTTLTKIGLGRFSTYKHFQSARDQEKTLLLEKHAIEFQLQNLKWLSEKKREKLITKMHTIQHHLERGFSFGSVEDVYDDIERRTIFQRGWKVIRWSLRNTLAFTITCCNLLFPGMIVLRGTLGGTRMILLKIYGTITKSSVQYYDGVVNFLPLINGRMLYAIDMCLIIYTVVSAFVGLYNSVWFHKMKPRRRETPIYKIVLNVWILLILSSSIPIVARLLDLSNFDLMAFYHYTEYMRNIYLVLLYKFIFLLKFAQRYFQLFPFTTLFQHLKHRFLYRSRKLKAT